jgi:hypothetical protein
MIAVTERAKKALLAKKLGAGIVDADVGLRLASLPHGTLLFVSDRAKAGDDVVKYRESIVLLVDPPTSAFVVTGRTIDCRRSEAGRIDMAGHADAA